MNNPSPFSRDYATVPQWVPNIGAWNLFSGLKPLSYPLLEGNPSPIEHDTTKIPSIVRLEACMDVLLLSAINSLTFLGTYAIDIA